MSSKTLNFIEAANPVHDYAKTELIPKIGNGWSFFREYLELFESEKTMLARLAQDHVAINEVADRLKGEFTDIEILNYKSYLELLLREQKNYSERLNSLFSFIFASFIVAFVGYADQSATILIIALLAAMPAYLFFTYRRRKVNHWSRGLRLACEFVEIGEANLKFLLGARRRKDSDCSN